MIEQFKIEVADNGKGRFYDIKPPGQKEPTHPPTKISLLNSGKKQWKSPTPH